MLWVTSSPRTLSHAAAIWAIRKYIDAGAEIELADDEPAGSGVKVLGPKTTLRGLLKSHDVDQNAALKALLKDVEAADRSAQSGDQNLTGLPALEELARLIRSDHRPDLERIQQLIETHLRRAGFKETGLADDDFFQSIVEGMPVGAMVLDHAGRAIYANQRMGVLLRSTPSGIIGRNVTKLPLDCVDRQGNRILEMSAVLRLAQNRNQPLDRVVTAVEDALGNPLFLATSFAPLQGQGELPPRVLVTAVDVTGEVLVEQSFRNSEERLQYILNSLPYGVMEFDADGKIVYANAALHRMFGYGMGELIGEPAWFCKSEPVDEQHVRAEYRRLLEGQWAPQFYLAAMKTKHGREIQMRVDWDYRRDGDLTPIGFVATMTDVSEDFMRRSEFVRQLEMLKPGGN